MENCIEEYWSAARFVESFKHAQTRSVLSTSNDSRIIVEMSGHVARRYKEIWSIPDWACHWIYVYLWKPMADNMASVHFWPDTVCNHDANHIKRSSQCFPVIRYSVRPPAHVASSRVWFVDKHILMHMQTIVHLRGNIKEVSELWKSPTSLYPISNIIKSRTMPELAQIHP